MRWPVGRPVPPPTSAGSAGRMVLGSVINTPSASVHPEWPGEREQTFVLLTPALGENICAVDVTSDSDVGRSFGEGKQTALGHAGACHVVPSQAGCVNEVSTPFGLDVRFSTAGVVRVRVSVASKP